MTEIKQNREVGCLNLKKKMQLTYNQEVISDNEDDDFTTEFFKVFWKQ